MSTHRAAPTLTGPLDLRARGTRFRLFAVYAEGMAPELITLPLPPGSIGPGPSDPDLSVADAADKAQPYDPPGYAPPFTGALLPPALPDAAGNFDHVPFGTPQFLAAHLYGSVRFTLEIWQDYLRRRIVWASAEQYPQMELVPLLDWNNAQSGPGFLETGLYRGTDGAMQPFALDFDVVGHETGHQILFSVIGVPDADEIGVPFLAFHEAFSDLIAIVAVMHFPSVLPRLLAQTEGNLASMAELAQAAGIGVILASIPPAALFPWRPELSPEPQIEAINAWLRHYAAAHHCQYADYWTVLKDDRGGLPAAFSSDGVHPNATGYLIMRPVVEAIVEKDSKRAGAAKRRKKL